MDFYYPNRINDFWRIMGIIFYGDKDYLYDSDTRTFKLPLIKAMLDEKGIALNDTGHAVRRLKDNASDKYLEIIEPVPLIGCTCQNSAVPCTRHNRRKSRRDTCFHHRYGIAQNRGIGFHKIE